MQTSLRPGWIALLLPLAAVAGYVLGTNGWRSSPHEADPHAQHAAQRTVLYWKDPDGKADFSSAPKQTADGRDYVPVHDDEEKALPGAPAQASAGANPSAPRKILYYRNPMGLADTSPEPKKDWMGMDYIPVYDGEEPKTGPGFTVPLAKIQRAGVRTQPAELQKLALAVRAPGIAKPNERTLRSISLRADGFIEKLYANEHGLHVKQGDPLFRVYSQEMLRALADYRLEARDASADPRRAVLSARQKLENLEVPPDAVTDARRDKELPMAFDWPSPVAGVIMEKKIIEGQMAKAGEELFLIGDLSNVWVIADVAEHDVDKVSIGADVRLTFHALPGETFHGKVTFILHELDRSARTGKVRIEVPNPDHRIRHEMYADVDISTHASDAERLSVPTSAVIDSGRRKVVLVALGDGRFEARDVTTGVRSSQRTEIKSGLAAGDRVVVDGNFLIDAEANLQSALSAFDQDPPAAAGKAQPEIAP